MASAETAAGNDSHGPYRVEHAAERLQLLRQLRDQAVPLQIDAPGVPSLSTVLWVVEERPPRVCFAASSQPAALQELVNAHEAVAVAYLDRVKLQVDLDDLVLVHGERGSVLQAPLPQQMYRFQRRDSFRVRSIEHSAPRALLRHPSVPDMELRLRVLDLSMGGCALHCPADVPPLQPGLRLQGVSIELDAATRFNVSLQLQHIASLPAPAEGLRLGCELRDLGGAAARVLQHYIDQTQKRRRALQLD